MWSRASSTFVFLFVGLALFCAPAYGQWTASQSGTPGNPGLEPGPYASAAAAIAAGIAYCETFEGGGIPVGGCEVTGVTFSGTSPRLFTAQHAAFGALKTQGQTFVPMSCGPDLEQGVDPEYGEPACVEPPPECDASVTGRVFWRPVFSADQYGNVCHEASQCKLTVKDREVLGGSVEALVEYVGTDEACSPADPRVPMTTENEATQCLQIGGDSWCTEPELADQNCGYYNNDFVCLNTVPGDGCSFFEGGAACNANAATPPAPDDGTTPGVKATPDGTITNVNATTSTTTTIDIFNNSTVNNSQGGVSGGHQGSGPAGGVGDGTGTETPTVELDLSELIEESTPEPETYSADIDASTDSMESELNDLIDDLGDPEQFGEEETISDQIAGAMGVLPCADYQFPVGGHSVTLSCSDAAPIRDWMRWIMGILFLLGMYELVISTRLKP